MKSKSQKYHEAVTRNIRNLWRPHYKEISIIYLRHKVGIRRDDESYDHLLTAFQRS